MKLSYRANFRNTLVRVLVAIIICAFTLPVLTLCVKKSQSVPNTKHDQSISLGDDYTAKNPDPPSSELEASKDNVSDENISTKVISKFSTNYSLSINNRKHNIQLAAKLIDGVEIEPAVTFSFNQAVGNRTEERGFKKAKTIFEGIYIEGVGGGVCQVSSTLFNAWLLAGQDIEESRCHSIEPSYILAGRDAMVSEYNDLKLKNTSLGKIKISAKADGNDLTISLIGTPSNVSVVLEHSLLKTFAPTPLYEEFGTGENIAYVEDYKEGSAYRLVANIYTDGNFTSSKVIRDSYYIAKTGKIYYTQKPVTPEA